MQFIDPKTNTCFTGELAEDPTAEYRQILLVLTPLANGPTVGIAPHDKHELLLTEVTLKEIFLPDGAGFSFPLHPFCRPSRSKR